MATVVSPHIGQIATAFREGANRTNEMYQIWLTNDAENVKFPLPLLPKEYTLKYGTNHGTFDIVGLGEVLVLKGRPLVTLSFSARFPAREVPGETLYELQPPVAYRDAIKGLQRSKWPCHLLITGANINLFTIIEDFQCTERGGDVGSLYYDITFKEWREVSSSQIEVDPVTKIAVVPKQKTQRPDNRRTPETYQVKPGDSLRKIARQYLGDEERWTDIYDLNRDKIAHPVIAPVGDVLQLPQ